MEDFLEIEEDKKDVVVENKNTTKITKENLLKTENEYDKDPIIQKVPDRLSNLSEGRKNLRSWLTRLFRVVITDGRIILGIFNCTDKDANIVLAMCTEYIEEGGEGRLLGNVMIPGKHIVSIEVDLLGQQPTT